MTHGAKTDDFTSRFVSTYKEYPPGVDHDTIVIANGGPLKTSTAILFQGMNVLTYPRENDPGYDVSAYIDAAKGPCANYDAMLCLGESNYFHREGWLRRLQDAMSKHGPGLYGPYGSFVLRAHLQTTAFFCHPLLLRQYPAKVMDRRGRMEFEHGIRSLWRRTAERRMPVKMVTWDGEWDPRLWRVPKNIIWRGDQSNCLMWCNHTDGWQIADDKRKASWSKSIDRPFK